MLIIDKPGRADVARWAFYNIGAQMCGIDTGQMHGPDCECCTDPIHGKPTCWVCRLCFPVTR